MAHSDLSSTFFAAENNKTEENLDVPQSRTPCLSGKQRSLERRELLSKGGVKENNRVRGSGSQKIIQNRPGRKKRTWGDAPAKEPKPPMMNITVPRTLRTNPTT